ncbi:MAG: YncE family protein [Deltaproteobacteria bacterium]|nr:YncE family protein [Deltaproteobacteria bacterium]MBW1792825.1 YncE family protein [Deltaproteobacteria bacterium]MBW2330713.1 YncE family protein [Deltaproteobacteria bacterium]
MQKMIIRFIAAMVAPICIISCAFEPDRKAPRFPDQGQVFFYLSCPKKPTFDISFSISGMSFMNKEGVWIDVALDKHVDSAELAERQIKLREFYLPAGKYKRVKWIISEARMKKVKKSFTLAVPQPGGEHFVDFEFSVLGRESQCLFADWDPEQSVFEKYLFRPELTIRKQGAEITKTLIYVTNTDSHCVTVIDREQDMVVASIAVGRAPVGIVARADGRRVYVANSGSDTISVIDTAINRVINTISNFGNSPAELALSEVRQILLLYATNPDSDNVSVIDTVARTVIGTIPVGKRPCCIVVDQDRRKIYVTNTASHTISVIDMYEDNYERSVEKTVTVGLKPTGMLIHEDRLYVANSASNNIYVMEIPLQPPYRPTKTISVGQKPTRMLSGLQERIYVSNANSNEISFVYPRMGLVDRNVMAGDLPSEMAIDQLRRKLYVINSMSEDVSVIDLPTYTMKKVVQVGKTPHGIALIEE